MRFHVSAFLVSGMASLSLHAADPLPGHSAHGETFNEGPRQAAVLIDGCGKVSFPATTRSTEAQQFINQGVGQLHGFWYYEAERSFRQAATLDPACAIAYWGCAMANVNNEKRAAGFIAEAMKRKDKASKREQAWITALQTYYADLKKDKKQRAITFIKDLEDIIHNNPDDIEAKAFLAWAIWKAKDAGVTMVSRESVDAIIQQIFAKAPMHPAHHYIIHLWDDSKPARAVASAALCGQTSPGIAHMWHMPGHTFSKVNRNEDAAWQQEAANRVDHAYMIRTRVLPDQIHNYAHNAEWLIRTYNQLGQAEKALGLAKNMVEIPRHPTWNTLEKNRSSAAYGRNRMLDTLLEFELWDEVRALDGSPLLDVSQNPSFEASRLRALGIAAYFKGDKPGVQKHLAEAQKLKTKQEAAPAPKTSPPSPPEKKKEEPTTLASLDKSNPKPGAKPAARPEGAKSAASVPAPAPAPSTPAAPVAASKPKDASKPAATASSAPAPAPAAPKKETPEVAKNADKPAEKKDDKPNPNPNAVVSNAIAELQALAAILDGKPAAEVTKLLDQAKDTPKERLVRYYLKLGNKEKAVTLANQLPSDAPGLALRIDALVQCGKMDDAKKQFATARKTASLLDANLALSKRLDELSPQLGGGKNWRQPTAPRKDSGVRPSLESLGPLHWHPMTTPGFTLSAASGKQVSLKDYAGKPVVVIFYLGSTCEHCMQQLKAFTSTAKDYAAEGIEIVAIGSEPPAELTTTAATCDVKSGAPFTLLSDADLKTFKAWRCHDDFEKTPLHGTFLIDAKGQMRWLDVSYTPFQDAKFLLSEAKRLLKFENAATP